MRNREVWSSFLSISGFQFLNYFGILRQKVSSWPKNIFQLVGLAEKITFPSLNYEQKVGFWRFFWRFRPAMYNTVVTPELLRGYSWLHCSLLTPFMRLVWHASPYGVLEGQYKNTCCNDGKIRSYAAVNIFYPPEKICSSLFSAPNSFIWLESYFRPPYTSKK